MVVVCLIRFRGAESRPNFLLSTRGNGRIRSFQGVQMTLMSQRNKKKSQQEEQTE